MYTNAKLIDRKEWIFEEVAEKQNQQQSDHSIKVEKNDNFQGYFDVKNTLIIESTSIIQCNEVDTGKEEENKEESLNHNQSNILKVKLFPSRRKQNSSPLSQVIDPIPTISLSENLNSEEFESDARKTDNLSLFSITMEQVHTKPRRCNGLSLKRLADSKKSSTGRHNKLELTTCHLCNKRFSSHHDRIQHINLIHQKVRSYFCTECEKSYVRKDQLQQHIHSVHVKFFPYSCETCEKKFSQRNKLAEHINAVHLKLKPYTCHLCGKKFARRGELSGHHSRIHEQPEKHVCAICDVPFHHKDELRVHISNFHQELRPYACDVCQIRFSKRPNMIRHLNVVHKKIKDHPCAECGMRFTRKRPLNRHIKAVHQKVA